MLRGGDCGVRGGGGDGMGLGFQILAGELLLFVYMFSSSDRRLLRIQ